MNFIFRMVFLIVGIYSSIPAQKYLPDNRKGDWVNAGYLRFLDSAPYVNKVRNVLSYGVTNDGLDVNNNNYRCIMKALADTVPGTVTLLFFPEGIYKISSPIVLHRVKRLILRGEGSEKTKIRFHFGGKNNLVGITLDSCEQVGLENFFITREDSTDFGDNIRISGTKCWVSGVESYQANSSHISILFAEHIDIIGCHIHHAWNSGPGGHGYGVIIGQGAHKCLVENNIFNHLRHSVILSNGPSSNVIAFNYSTDPYTTEKYFGISDWPSDLCLHGHPDPQLPGPHRNLFEGNIGAFMHADEAWKDNGPYNTYFRNRATYYGLKIYKDSDSQNIVANEVDDADGTLPDMLWNAFTIQSSDNFVYGNTNFDPDPPQYPLPQDYSADRSLYRNPDSLPQFLAALPFFPPIGVVDSNHQGSGTIPAKQRWDLQGVLTVPHPQHPVNISIPEPDLHKKKNTDIVSLGIRFKKDSDIIITYSLTKASPIIISIYTLRGQLVKTLINRLHNPGRYTVDWNCCDNYGNRVAPGMYIIKVGNQPIQYSKHIVIL